MRLLIFVCLGLWVVLAACSLGSDPEHKANLEALEQAEIALDAAEEEIKAVEQEALEKSNALDALVLALCKPITTCYEHTPDAIWDAQLVYAAAMATSNRENEEYNAAYHAYKLAYEKAESSR